MKVVIISDSLSYSWYSDFNRLYGWTNGSTGCCF